ncbi:unnamed protein product [Rotaria sordida]|uniref:HAT C-terminal dimerisation domain-containing protein n=1 Tax=Rotaria sordida TaxID=392033 RepID=A0A819VM35_9BILA|nr:unnamed protein product [Rotaria sordida]CAF1625153.1 unnamed protein product [Rotaria sordida]CAF3989837.1 unnamed protein product [Rotaria sordida]CAF4046386.1 unnamed protein product [Rotaria sordida]CAF4111678.1 unnamed protein product [Rotaria sordida]
MSIDKYVPLEESNPKTIAEEISHYGLLCKDGPLIDAVTFWQRYGEQMSLLKSMAQQYLSTPETSVASESAFSISTYVARKEWTRLSPKNSCYTVFLQDKLRSR